MAIGCSQRNHEKSGAPEDAADWTGRDFNSLQRRPDAPRRRLYRETRQTRLQIVGKPLQLLCPLAVQRCPPAIAFGDLSHGTDQAGNFLTGGALLASAVGNSMHHP